MCKLVHGHLCVAINSISHGLACLDLLPHIQDVPIGNTFQELGDFRSVCLHLMLALKVIVPMQLDGEPSCSAILSGN